MPPELLAWVGAIGGLVGITTSVLNLVFIWRNRRRIGFRTVTADCYYETWTQVDIDQLGPASGSPGAKFTIKEGDYKRAFIVIEFVVKNHYPYELAIGRFQIDGWMFADKYIPEMYPPKRDYQVFNLYTHTPTSLDKFEKVAPNGSYGLRVEILDEVHDSFTSMRSRKTISLPDSYVVEFHTDIGSHKHKIEIKPAEQIYYNNFQVYRWSNLLEPLKLGPDGAPRPQGVKGPNWKSPKLQRLLNWYKVKRNLLLYASRHRLPNQPNRLTRFIKHLVPIRRDKED